MLYAYGQCMEELNQELNLPKNFGMVSTNLYRSGLPTQSQIRFLVINRNIEAVIDLTERNRDSVVKVCNKIGIDYFKCPMIDTDLNIGLIDQAMEVIESHPNSLIHCWAGKHRTGLVVALVQKRLGFSNSKILQDLFGFGFGDPLNHKVYFDYILEQLC